MQKKRIIALGTAMAISMTALLAGCGKTEIESSNSSQSSQSVQKEESKTDNSSAVSEEPKVELEPVTLTYWLPGEDSEDRDKVNAAINEYLKDVLPNTTVDIEMVNISEWASRWSKSMAASEVVDLAWFGYTNKIDTEIELGSLMEIDDLVAEYGQGIVEVLGQDFVDLHRTNGELYFLPAWQGAVSGRRGIYFPSELVDLVGGDAWLEKLQKELYDVWEEPNFSESKYVFDAYFTEYLEAVYDAGKSWAGYDPLVSPLSYAYLSNTEVPSISGLNSVDVSVVGDTVYMEAYNSSTYYHYHYYEVLNDWYKKGYIRKDIASLDAKNGWEYEGAYENGFNIYTHNGWTDDEDLRISDKVGFEVDGVYITPINWLSTGFVTGAVIPSTAKNPERAMMLLNLIYTDADLYHLFVYGIEGEHYTKNSDGTITYAENNKYKGSENWQLGTCENSYQTDPLFVNYYNDLKASEATARERFLKDFTFDKTNVKVEITNIGAVLGEYKFLYTYDNWKELLDERNKKMHDAGMEAYITEAYNQLLPYCEERGYKLVIRGDY